MVRNRCYRILVCNTLFWPFLSFILLIKQINHYSICPMCFNKWKIEENQQLKKYLFLLLFLTKKTQIPVIQFKFSIKPINQNIMKTIKGHCWLIFEGQKQVSIFTHLELKQSSDIGVCLTELFVFMWKIRKGEWRVFNIFQFQTNHTLGYLSRRAIFFSLF